MGKKRSRSRSRSRNKGISSIIKIGESIVRNLNLDLVQEVAVIIANIKIKNIQK